MSHLTDYIGQMELVLKPGIIVRPHAKNYEAAVEAFDLNNGNCYLLPLRRDRPAPELAGYVMSWLRAQNLTLSKEDGGVFEWE